MTEVRLSNWKTQIKKGYIELCILAIIDNRGRVYGFELLELLREYELPVKDGTLYPLLSRMTSDGILDAVWETENIKGHPRKFYSMTDKGQQTLTQMKKEFERMGEIYSRLHK